MDRLRRRRGDEVSDEWRAPAPRRDPPTGAEAESLLDLQARAGNRAVTELVGATGSDVGRTSVQRDGADGTPKKTPDDKSRSAGGTRMSIPELKLALPVQSVGGFRQGRGGRDGNRGPVTAAGDATVTLLAEDMDRRLYEAAVKGSQFDTITITFATGTLTLRGVTISSVNWGTSTASLVLNYSSMVFQPAEKQPPPSSEWAD